MREPTSAEMRNYDAAKRLSDTIALHQTVLTREEIIAKRFIAVKLADGRTDGVVYDSTPDAVRHQKGDVTLYGYPQIPLERWSPAVCDTLLWYWKGVYDAGWRPSVDTNQSLYLPRNVEDVERYANDARRRAGQ